MKGKSVTLRHSKKPVKEKALSNDTLLDGSNTTVYMGLPPATAADVKKDSAESKSSRSSTKSLRRRDSEKSSLKSSKKSLAASEEVAKSDEPTAPPPTGDNAKASDNDISPDMLQAFREFLQQQQQQSQAEYPNPSTSQAPAAQTIPAELAHQLYLSYLSAYYAGATGVWPPPAPPAYIMPHRAGNSAAAQFPFFQASAFPNYMVPPMEDKSAQQQPNYGYPYLPFASDQTANSAPGDHYQSGGGTLQAPPGGEDYAPSPAYQAPGDGVMTTGTTRVRRDSLERAFQSDSCKSSTATCEDDQPGNVASAGNDAPSVSSSALTRASYRWL
ncbi:MAG: hypothetical protein AAFP26_13515 [Planctomycetota bacterium]